MGSTNHVRLSSAGITTDSLPRSLAAGEVPTGGVAGERGLSGDERVNHPPSPGAERGRASGVHAGAGSGGGSGARLPYPTLSVCASAEVPAGWRAQQGDA